MAWRGAKKEEKKDSLEWTLKCLQEEVQQKKVVGGLSCSKGEKRGEKRGDFKDLRQSYGRGQQKYVQPNQ